MGQGNVFVVFPFSGRHEEEAGLAFCLAAWRGRLGVSPLLIPMFTAGLGGGMKL